MSKWDACETTEIYGWKKTRETDIETEEQETEKRQWPMIIVAQ